MDKYPFGWAKALRLLACELATLEEGQGRVARRRARKRVRAKLRAIERAMDATHPPIVERRKPRRSGALPAHVKQRRLERGGWLPIPFVGEGEYLRAFAVAKVPVREAPGRNGSATFYAPAWALSVPPDAKKLAALRKDRRAQRMALVKDALASGE